MDMWYHSLFRYNIDLFNSAVSTLFSHRHSELAEAGLYVHSLATLGLRCGFFALEFAYGMHEDDAFLGLFTGRKSSALKFLFGVTSDLFSFVGSAIPWIKYVGVGSRWQAPLMSMSRFVGIANRGLYENLFHCDFRDRYISYTSSDLLCSMRSVLLDNSIWFMRYLKFNTGWFDCHMKRLNAMRGFVANLGHLDGNGCPLCLSALHSRGCTIKTIGVRGFMNYFDYVSMYHRMFSGITSGIHALKVIAATGVSLLPMIPQVKISFPWFYRDLYALQMKAALLYTVPALLYKRLEEVKFLGSDDVLKVRTRTGVVDTYDDGLVVETIDSTISSRYIGRRTFLLGGFSSLYLDFLYKKFVGLATEYYSLYDIFCILATRQEDAGQKMIFSSSEFEGMMDPFRLLYAPNSLINALFVVNGVSVHPMRFMQFLFKIDDSKLESLSNHLSDYGSLEDECIAKDAAKLEQFTGISGYAYNVIVKPKLAILNLLRSVPVCNLNSIHGSVLAFRGRKLDYARHYTDLAIEVLGLLCEELSVRAIIPLVKEELAPYFTYADYKPSDFVNGHCGLVKCLDVPINVGKYCVVLQHSDVADQLELYQDTLTPRISHFNNYEWILLDGDTEKYAFCGISLLAFIDYLSMYVRYDINSAVDSVSRYNIPVLNSLRGVTNRNVSELLYDYLPECVRSLFVFDCRDMFGAYVKKSCGASLYNTMYVGSAAIYYNVIGDALSHHVSTSLLGDMVVNGLMSWWFKTRLKVLASDYITIPNDYVRHVFSYVDNARLLLFKVYDESGECLRQYIGINLSNIVCGRLHYLEKYVFDTMPGIVRYTVQPPYLVYIDMIRRGIINYGQVHDIYLDMINNIMFNIFGIVAIDSLSDRYIDAGIMPCVVGIVSGRIHAAIKSIGGFIDNSASAVDEQVADDEPKRTFGDVDKLVERAKGGLVAFLSFVFDRYVSSDDHKHELTAITDVVALFISKGLLGAFKYVINVIDGTTMPGRYFTSKSARYFDHVPYLVREPHLGVGGRLDYLSGYYWSMAGNIMNMESSLGDIFTYITPTTYVSSTHDSYLAYVRHVVYFDYSNSLLLKLLEIDFRGEFTCLSSMSDMYLVEFSLRSFLRDFLWNYNCYLGFNLAKPLIGFSNMTAALDFAGRIFPSLMSLSSNEGSSLDSTLLSYLSITAPTRLWDYQRYVNGSIAYTQYLYCLLYLDDRVFLNDHFAKLKQWVPNRDRSSSITRLVWHLMLIKFPIFTYLAPTADLLGIGPSIISNVSGRSMRLNLLIIVASVTNSILAIFDNNVKVSCNMDNTRMFRRKFSSSSTVSVFSKYPVPTILNYNVYLGKPEQFLMLKKGSVALTISMTMLLDKAIKFLCSAVDKIAVGNTYKRFNLNGQYTGSVTLTPHDSYLDKVWIANKLDSCGLYTKPFNLLLSTFLHSNAIWHALGFSIIPDLLLSTNLVVPGKRIGINFMFDRGCNDLIEVTLYPIGVFSIIMDAGHTVNILVPFWALFGLLIDAVGIGMYLFCGSTFIGSGRCVEMKTYRPTSISDYDVDLSYVNGHECIAFGSWGRYQQGKGLVGAAKFLHQSSKSLIGATKNLLKKALSNHDNKGNVFYRLYCSLTGKSAVSAKESEVQDDDALDDDIVPDNGDMPSDGNDDASDEKQGSIM